MGAGNILHIILLFCNHWTVWKNWSLAYKLQGFKLWHGGLVERAITILLVFLTERHNCSIWFDALNNFAIQLQQTLVSWQGMFFIHLMLPYCKYISSGTSQFLRQVKLQLLENDTAPTKRSVLEYFELLCCKFSELLWSLVKPFKMSFFNYILKMMFLVLHETQLDE